MLLDTIDHLLCELNEITDVSDLRFIVLKLVIIYTTVYTFHRLLKLRTDGGYARVRKLGSIDFVFN